MSGDVQQFTNEDGVWVSENLGAKPGDTIRLQIDDTAEYIVRGVLKRFWATAAG